MIYVTGDIHGRVERILYQIQRLDIQPEDTIVLLGDAGLNYYGNYLGDWDRKKALDQEITVLSTDMPVFEAALKIHGMMS